MSITIRASVQIIVAVDRVAFSRNYGLAALRLDPGADAHAVIPLIPDNRQCMRQSGNQYGRYRAVMDWATRDPELDRQAIGIHRQMQLSGQPRSAFANGLRGRAHGARTVLMGLGVGAVPTNAPYRSGSLTTALKIRHHLSLWHQARKRL